MELDHDGDGGFEIADYTKATDWERLIAAVEDCFRRWQLGSAASQRLLSPQTAMPNPLVETLQGSRKKVVDAHVSHTHRHTPQHTHTITRTHMRAHTSNIPAPNSTSYAITGARIRHT